MQDEILPGGRFSCAQCLADRQIPFLVGKSLGEICHIVQLAISQKKILGYSNGGITCYANSQSMLKDTAAAQQSARASASVDELPLASWTVARTHLREILRSSMAEGSDSVPLSNIKRVFRSQFQIELSETALGYAKLSELLQDSRLADTCTVRLLDQGYFVIAQFNLDDECRVEEAEELCLQEEMRAATDRWYPRSPFAFRHDGQAGSAIRNTFIHTGSGAHEGSRVRSQSLMKNFGSCREEEPDTLHMVELELPNTPGPQPFATFTPGAGLQTFSPFSSWADAGDDRQSAETRSFKFSVTDVDASDSLTIIDDIQLPLTPAVPALKTASPFLTWGEPPSADGSVFKFCVDEPLNIDDASYYAKPSPAVTPSPWTPQPNPMPLISLSRPAFRLSDFV
jgi:hypothetical protein